MTQPLERITEAEFLKSFEAVIKESGGVRSLARKLNVSSGYISQVRKGKIAPGPAILDPMKLTRIVIRTVEYRRRSNGD